ncbi:MAG: hypothetical protein JWO81_2333 [Alphaproteobacteria bacterium]|nr:hypothetical protein [Alphaproteobacteria bacterium]
MRRSAILWLMLGLGAAGPARAASGDVYNDRLLSREYHRCFAEDSSTSGMGQCLEYEEERQEGRLNQAYRMVMTRLPAARKAALLSSERAWVKARERECERVYRDMAGGTGDGAARLMCRSVRAAERTSWLERFR